MQNKLILKNSLAIAKSSGIFNPGHSDSVKEKLHFDSAVHARHDSKEWILLY